VTALTLSKARSKSNATTEKLDREPSMVDLNRREPSLSRLERESEQTRAQLAHTVEELRTRVSPAALKQDAKDYVRHTGEEILHKMERRARENPLQAIAIAAGLAYPVWRIVRSIPAPILLIGAGLALARPSGRSGYGNGKGIGGPNFLDHVRESVGDATDAVKDKVRQTSDVAQEAASVVREAASATAEQLAGTAERLQAAVSSGLDSARAGAAETADSAKRAMHSAGDETAAALSAARGQAARVAQGAQDGLLDAIERNPLVVGGIGLFLGALIAAAIPGSRAENRLMGDTSDELKSRARDLAAQGYETAKGAAANVYQAGKQAADEQGLSPEGVRDAIHQIGEKVSTVYERATNPDRVGEASRGEQSAWPGAAGTDARKS
jgi:ElaB/YqjD/DUF883 family membrane-anchored ribosome-binding protein